MKYLPLFLLLIGCSKYSGPYHKCLESHDELMTTFITDANGNMTPSTYWYSVCDKYSVQQYIRVDKKIYEVQYVYEE